MMELEEGDTWCQELGSNLTAPPMVKAAGNASDYLEAVAAIRPMTARSKVR